VSMLNISLTVSTNKRQMKELTLMVIKLYFHSKIVNICLGPNPGLGPRVNPGFGFEKSAGYPGLRGPGFGLVQ
jgi:hypothetical protein